MIDAVMFWTGVVAWTVTAAILAAAAWVRAHDNRMRERRRTEKHADVDALARAAKLSARRARVEAHYALDHDEMGVGA